MEEMLMIHSRSPKGYDSYRSICAMAYLQPKKIDLVFTAMVMSQVSSGGLMDASRRSTGLNGDARIIDETATF